MLSVASWPLPPYSSLPRRRLRSHFLTAEFLLYWFSQPRASSGRECSVHVRQTGNPVLSRGGPQGRAHPQGLVTPHASQPGRRRFHYMNAYEEGSKVHLDFAHHDTPEMLNTLYLDVMRRGDRALVPGPLRCLCLPRMPALGPLPHAGRTATFTHSMCRTNTARSSHASCWSRMLKQAPPVHSAPAFVWTSKVSRTQGLMARTHRRQDLGGHAVILCRVWRQSQVSAQPEATISCSAYGTNALGS